MERKLLAFRIALMGSTADMKVMFRDNTDRPPPQLIPDERPLGQEDDSDPIGFIGGLVAGAMCSGMGSSSWMWALGVLVLQAVPALGNVMQPVRPLLNLNRVLGTAVNDYAAFILIGALLVSFLPLALAATTEFRVSYVTMRNGLIAGWVLGLLVVPFVLIDSVLRSLRLLAGI